MSLGVPLSILDLALIGDGETARDALDATVALAREAALTTYTGVGTPPDV